jgi:hypothetical protein
VTSGIEPTGQKKTVIALAAIIAVLVIALSTLAFIIFFREPDGPPRVMTTPPIPSAPPVPGVPQPQPPPGAPLPDSLSPELIYPGSKITMEMSGGRKGRVVKLSTPDAIETVVDWYVNKIGPAKRVKLPGGNTVLTREGLAVVITPEDDGTSILLTQGEN